MPRFEIQEPDELPVADGDLIFSRGFVDSLRPNALAEGAFADAKNLDYDPLGRLGTRRGILSYYGSLTWSTSTNVFSTSTMIFSSGTALLIGFTGPVKGLCYAEYGNTEYLFVADSAASNNVFYCTEAGTKAAVTGSTGTGTQVWFAQLGKKLFFCDGTASLGLKYIDITSPTTAVAGTNAPLSPKLLICFKDRLFCTSSDTSTYAPDTIFISDVLTGDNMATVNQSIRISGDADPIVAIHPWYDFNLLVFKERSVWIVNADPSIPIAQWQILMVNNRIGCVAANTVQSVGSDVLFLARDGIRTIQTINQGGQTDISQPVSTPINKTIQLFPQATASSLCAVYFRENYLLAGGSVGGESIYPFNVTGKTWAGHWDYWYARHLCITYFGGKPRLVIGDTSGRVSLFLDFDQYDTSEPSQLYQDYGSDNIQWHLITRAYTHGERHSDKVGEALTVTFDNPTGSSQTVNLYYADNLSTSFTSLATVTVPANTRYYQYTVNMLGYNRYRCRQLKLTGNGRVAILEIVANAFVEGMQLEAS